MKCLRDGTIATVRFVAECFGYATILGLLIVPSLLTWYEQTTRVVRSSSPIQVSPIAAKIAAKFSPVLQDLAEEHKEEVVASAGNAVYRFAARRIFPVAVKAIPRGVEIGTDKALSYLDSMPISEVAGLMVEHAKTRGCVVDYSTWQAAQKP